MSDCEGENSDRERSKKMEMCVNAIDVKSFRVFRTLCVCVCFFFWWGERESVFLMVQKFKRVV